MLLIFFLDNKLQCILQDKNKLSSAQSQKLIILLLSSNTRRLVLVKWHTPAIMFKFFSAWWMVWWWEEYLSKLSLIKHTCSLRVNLYITNTEQASEKFLNYIRRLCNSTAAIQATEDLSSDKVVRFANIMNILSHIPITFSETNLFPEKR